MENIKVLIFKTASVKNDLNNLHIGLEYLIIEKLILDCELNLPITLKELQINNIVRSVQAINTIMLYDDGEEEEMISEIENLRVPFGCTVKHFKADITSNRKRKGFGSIKTVYYLKTEISKEDFKNNTIGYISDLKFINGVRTACQIEASKVYGKIRKNKPKYNLRIHMDR